MTRPAGQYQLTATVRCPWCGLIAAEFWFDGSDLRQLDSDPAVLALHDEQETAESKADPFAPPAPLTGHPWCGEPAKHRWVLPVHLQRKVTQPGRDTPVHLHAKRVSVTECNIVLS